MGCYLESIASVILLASMANHFQSVTIRSTLGHHSTRRNYTQTLRAEQLGQLTYVDSITSSSSNVLSARKERWQAADVSIPPIFGTLTSLFSSYTNLLLLYVQKNHLPVTQGTDDCAHLDCCEPSMHRYKLAASSIV
jgi:hypothetical protein